MVTWNVAKRIVGLSFDTTSVNTGIHMGACKYLEIFLGRALMWFPCMHHILELVLGSVIQQRWKTSGLRDAIYGRFKNEWPNLLEAMPDILRAAKDKVALVVVVVVARVFKPWVM